ncbi:MAG: restriction endonuclease subunit S [Aeromonas sp.]
MTWPMVKLKNCCTIVGGATPRRDEKSFWDSPDIPWVTPKDISNLKNKVIHDAPEYISQLGFDKSATFMLPEGSVLLTSRAPIGNLAVTGKPMCTNQGFKSLVPNPDVDCTYLYYCMLANIEKLQALGNGATFKEVSKKVVEDFEIPLPPLDEQKRIAAILDKADAIRQKRQQAIALADDFLRSVFLDMFGDPVTNPKGWDEVILKDIADIRSGVTKGKIVKEDDAITLPYMRVANVQDGYLDLSSIQEITVSQKDAKKSMLQIGDILLTEGGDPDKLGRGHVWNGEIENCIHQNHIFSVRVIDSNYIRPSFLSSVISSPRGKKYFLKVGKQTTGIATINKTVLSEFLPFIPPLEMQDKYLGIMKKMKKLPLYSEQNYIKLFSALSQKAFSGQL